MPVVPPDVPQFTIQPPMTTGDRGSPSRSILKDSERVFAMIEDERHLVAYRLYRDVLRRLLEWEKQQMRNSVKGKFRMFLPGSRGKDEKFFEAEECGKVRGMLSDRKEIITKLENRCRIFQKAQKNLNSDDDWTFASLHFGITTFYRREEDGSLSIKLEGEINGVPLFEQIAVLRDVDLHQNWVPFCTASKTIADLDKLDLVGWFMVGVPQIGLARDGCFRVIGCDNMSEDGSIIIAGQGVNDIMPGNPPPQNPFLAEDPIISKLDIPLPPTKRGNGRVTIRKFETVVHVISPTAATTRIVANIDPNIPFLSQSIIDFALKHLAGVMLGKLQSAAKKAVKNPATNVHAQKMREDALFYQTWLMAKFKGFCDERGWEMPTVGAFALNEEQILSNKSKQRRVNTFGGVEENIIHDSFDVSNLDSAQTSQKRSVDEHDDTVSEITTRSNLSLWRNNPVSNFLRAKEEIRQQKKEAKIAEIRQRVSDLIKPKQLSFEQQERLEELRLAKSRRLSERPVVSSDASVSNGGSSVGSDPEMRKVTIVQRVTTRLHKHRRFTRTFVLSTFVSLLSILLHPELFYKILLGKVFGDLPETPLVEWSLDAATAFYIMLCSFVHSCLCDICLVYAFAALELGGKSGGYVKRYYGKRVRVSVVAISVGIAVFGLAKASLRALLYFTVEVLMQMSSMAHSLASGPAVGIAIENAVARLDAFMEQSPNEYVGYLLVGFRWFRQFAFALPHHTEQFLHKIPISDALLGLIVEFYETMCEVIGTRLSALIDWIIDQIPEAYIFNTHLMWRQDAFKTCRVLFSYTSVFLVTIVLLFLLTAKKGTSKLSRRSTAGDDDSSRSVGTSEIMEHVTLPAASSPVAVSSASISTIPHNNKQQKESKSVNDKLQRYRRRKPRSGSPGLKGPSGSRSVA